MAFHKYGYWKSVQVVADALVEIYGEELKEYGHDVDMAENVVAKLSEGVDFNDIDTSRPVYTKWRYDRDPLKNKEDLNDT